VAKQPLFKTQRGQKRAVAVAMFVVLAASVGVAAAYVQAVRPTKLTYSAVRVGMITLSVPDAWPQSPAPQLKGFPAAARYTDPDRPTRQLTVIAAKTPSKQSASDILNSFARTLISGESDAADGQTPSTGQSPEQPAQQRAQGPITARSFSPVRTRTMAGIKLVANQIQPDRMTVHTLAVLTQDNQRWFAVYLIDTVGRDFQSVEQLGANDKLFNTILTKAQIEADPRARNHDTETSESTPPTAEPSTPQGNAPNAPR